MKRFLSKTIGFMMATVLVVSGMFFGSTAARVHAEEAIPTVTVKEIEIKVGDGKTIYGEQLTNMMKEAGYNYKGLSVWFETFTFDSSIVAATHYVGALHENADGSLDELGHVYASNKEVGKYFANHFAELKKLFPGTDTAVEDAEGLHETSLRGEKEGQTTVVNEALEVLDENDQLTKIKLVIPVKVLPADKKTVDAKETTVDAKETTTGKSTDSTIKNSDTAEITINNENGVLPAGTTMKAVKLTSGTVFESAKKTVVNKIPNLKKVELFEIDLKNSAGAEIHQLNGKVQVKMAAPFKPSKNNTIKVYRVDGDNLVACTSVLSGDVLTFETDHFSTYAFVEEPAVKAPKTGDSANYMLILIGLAFMSLVCKSFAVIKK